MPGYDMRVGFALVITISHRTSHLRIARACRKSAANDEWFFDAAIVPAMRQVPI
jgi:hypothetical protein